MKLPFLILSISLMLIVASCSSTKKTAREQAPVSQIQNPYVSEVSIDGKEADWQGIALNTSPEKTFEYSVAHNARDLFLIMKLTNPVEQMKFLTGGMELWIDPSRQKQQKAEVIYPVKGELAASALQPQNNSSDKKQNREMMHLNIRAQVVSMNRIGFKPEYSGIQTISQNTGFKAAINWNESDELIYELKVPFEAFNSTVSKDKVDIEFSIGALERPTETHRSNEDGSGYRQGGMAGGMRGGGGYRGGGQGRYGGSQRNGERRNGGAGDIKTDWQKIREKESFWVECNS